MKNLLKTPFPLAGKSCFRLHEFQQAKRMFFFKCWPTFNFKNGVHQPKKTLNKVRGLQLTENPFPLARIKDSLKNTIPLDQKLLHLNQCLKKMKQKVYTSRNKNFLKY